jgi:hypothetical protein
LGNTVDDWYFPVVGENQWKSGSWMPNTPREHQDGRTHPAIDIYAQTGAPIVAPVSGEILRIGVNTRVGGNWVVLQGDDGIEYYFAHMQNPTHLDSGARVEAGWVLGGVGDTGSAKGTSPHVHLSMKTSSGQYIDPRPWLTNGAQPNPMQYALDVTQRSRSGLSEQLRTDPFFVGAPTEATPDPIQSGLRTILDQVSATVAGGTRMRIDDAMSSQAAPSDGQEPLTDMTPKADKPRSVPVPSPRQTRDAQ